ncbi:hypothetical protein GCM10009863_28010 [Streptomyces axinellae]|uniref:MFS transporter n=1 Tax=Streptomyces axinellae TaxID=552788 RepID=A0ABN3Q476_9ACTN
MPTNPASPDSRHRSLTLLSLAPGPLLYVCVALTSAALYVPFSPHVTLGQDYLPRRVGTAGGVTLGLTVSIGGLASPLIGALADATTLRTALAPLIVLPALGRLLLRGLKEPAAPAAVPGRNPGSALPSLADGAVDNES